MAQVYLAERRRPATFEVPRVVLKVVRQELLSDDVVVGMFLEEGRLLARLRHPNVVQVIQVDVLNDIPYLVMEYVHGPTLYQIRRRVGRPDEASLGRLLRIVASACEGLHHAHTADLGTGAHGVVHRDVSLQNILVSAESGTTKLIDFGIAKAPDSEWDTDHGLLRGKLSYLAPELIYGASATAASDVFAVGVIVHWLVLGRMPYASTVPLEQRARALPSSLPGVPEDLAHILRSAMAAEPEARPTADELSRALHDAATDRACPPHAIQSFVKTVFPRGEEDWQHLVRPVAEHGTLARLASAYARTKRLWRLAIVAIIAALLAVLVVGLTALGFIVATP